jgi:MarR family transcriptional regulator, organic hydroperoxide resistance regulator
MDRSDLPTRADDLFCHAVYGAWHVINRAYKKHLAPLGLTYPQYITLVLLWERDAQRVSDLATALEMETSTLTPLLKRLEARGHVSRNRGVVDERHVIITLTPHGRALRTQAQAITACMIADTGLSGADLAGLMKTLATLRAGLKQRAGA